MPEGNDLILAEFSWAKMTRKGLFVTQRTPEYAEWYSDFVSLLEYEQATQWSIGDAYVVGELAYRDKDPSQPLTHRRVKIKTIQNYAWVCRRIPYNQRKFAEDVSFSHHAVVAKLEPHRRDHWLQEVINRDLTVEELEELTADERGVEYYGSSPLDQLLRHYNNSLKAFHSLPNIPEKKEVQHALKVLENAIRKLESRLSKKKEAA